MFLVLFILNGIHTFKVPGGCEVGHFYEPSLMNCLPCPANASLVTSIDGFGCSCTELSIPVGISQCKPCNKTEMISSDGFSCVPRRCQSSAGRTVCRKCPIDYISVTQNFDGSPMKEVQCVRCARGYKASNNHCTRCETCTCNKFELIVRGKCIPKKYIVERPKYSENILHPNEVLEAIKLEYLCTTEDLEKNILYHNFIILGFPLLTIDDLKSNKAELSLKRGMDTLEILLAIHTSSGGFNILQNPTKKQYDCLPPLEIKIGSDFKRDCVMNVSEVKPPSHYGDLFELFLASGEDLKPLPIVVQKPNGYYVEKGAWTSKKFRKFFLINKFLSTVTNTTSTVYLRTLLLHIRIDRDSSSKGSLKLLLSIEVQYASKSPLSNIITTSIRVEHQLPDAGVLGSLEISGGILVAIMVIYGVIQTRGSVRRGGHYVAIVPFLSSCVADALYFATCASTLHAFVVEAGTLGFTLPLSQDEEHLISAILYAAVTLKFVKVLWINWKQCRSDLIFIDWSQYNPPVKAPHVTQNNWKMDILATYWISMQTKRRVSPGYTVTITLLILYLISPWESYLPRSRGYRWVTAASVWWFSYSSLSCVFIVTEKLVQPHRARFSKLCTDLEISVLVFQEDYYGHYVNGRNDDLYTRSMSYSLASCRLVCSPQLRNVFVKIQTSSDFGETSTKHALLSRFLGAFFERALDGLNWVASERTILERLLDVEIVEREGGNTSVLLYDNNITTPSCFAVTWMGEEWTLATFDAMLFGSVLIASDQSLLAALVTIIVWKVIKFARMFFSYWNLKIKI